jgi:DNA-binding NarL/FixJ family response regulator
MEGVPRPVNDAREGEGSGGSAGLPPARSGHPTGQAANRILLVEDEAIVAWDIAETATRLGYVIVGMADTAEQAIALAESQSPDLILMDIRLNGPQDGIAAAAAIRTRTGLRVVYLTAHGDIATMRRAAATEPLGYVLKPFSLEGLRNALALAGRRLVDGSSGN